MLRVFTFLCLALFAGTATAQDNGPKIVYHGNSFFEVHSSKGTIVVFDPHLIESYPRILDKEGRPVMVKADIALFSHPHNDHTQVGALDMTRLKKENLVPGFKGTGQRATWNKVDKKIKDVHIRSVSVYHDNMQGMVYGINTIFIIEVDGWKIAHLGDLGHSLSKRQLKQIGTVDVLMIPVGGIYTLNGSEAKEVTKQIEPREYVIPMHYGTPHFDELLDTEEFLDGQPMRQVVQLDTNEMTLTRDPNGVRPLTVVMHYLPKGQQ